MTKPLLWATILFLLSFWCACEAQVKLPLMGVGGTSNGGATKTVVQNSSFGNSNTGTITLTFGSATTAHNSLMVAITSNGSAISSVSLTHDTLAQRFTKNDGAGNFIYLFDKCDITGGDTTVTVSFTNTDATIAEGVEVSGTATGSSTACVDPIGVTPASGTGTSLTANSVSPATSTDFYMGVSIDDIGQLHTLTSSGTVLFNSTLQDSGSAAYFASSSSSAFNFSWTMASSTTWAAGTQGYK